MTDYTNYSDKRLFNEYWRVMLDMYEYKLAKPSRNSQHREKYEQIINKLSKELEAIQQEASRRNLQFNQEDSDLYCPLCGGRELSFTATTPAQNHHIDTFTCHQCGEIFCVLVEADYTLPQPEPKEQLTNGT